jgi:IQ and AAA domain-containing protein
VHEAVLVLQRNECGRQAREAARIKLINKKQRQLADRRNRTGFALTQEMAVTKIQSALRGMLWRKRIKEQADDVCLLLLNP